MNPPSPTYYSILDVSPTADRAEIRRAYLRLARKYHPDVNPGDRVALERLKQINEAYEVLSVPESRSQYDQSIGLSTPSNAAYQPAYTAAGWYQRGLQLSLRKRYQEAIECYDRALAINLEFVKAYNQRGFSYYKLGKSVEALADYNQALTIDNQHATSYYYRGLTRFQLGYSQGAIADFDRAIAIDPDHGQAYYHRAISHRDLKEYHAARKDFIGAEQVFLQQNNTLAAAEARMAYRRLGVVNSNSLIRNIGWLPIDIATVLLKLITNPQQCMAICYGRLPSQRAIALTIFLVLGFGWIWFHTVNSLWSNLAVLGVIEGKNVARASATLAILTGLIPFIALMLTNVLSQQFAKQRIDWSASHFLAGVGLLPLYGIFLAMGNAPLSVFQVSGLVCVGYLFLLLYGGYRYGLRCNHAIAITFATCFSGLATLPILLWTT